MWNISKDKHITHAIKEKSDYTRVKIKKRKMQKKYEMLITL